MTDHSTFKILPAALTVLGVAVLCSLGTWQLQRLEWKENLLAEIEREYRIADADLPEITEANMLGTDFRRVKASGTLLMNNMIMIKPRTRDGEVGAHIYSPLLINGEGPIVYTNLGWMAENVKLKLPAEMNVSYVGLLQTPPQRNPFTPENNPQAGEWYHPDVYEMAAVHEFSAPLPYFFYKEGISDGPISPLPMPPELKNDHLYYACFWFFMAFAMITIYILRFHVKKSA